MNKLRLLIVEDVEQELESFRDDLEDYTQDKQRDIDLVECRTLEEALNTLDNSFDGAIIDLKLANHRSNEGNQVIEKIIKSFFRIPIAIFTGNPGDYDHNLNEKTMLIGIFTKGETEHYELLDRFWEIYNTGLTHILGGRGAIEKCLNDVFLKNLLPQIQTWVSYGMENSEQTEKALLRYALNHLLQLLEEEEERCFPEEFYLYPPVSEGITTGSIVKEKMGDQPFVVLSPACDLVIRRDREFKTDRILLVEIESENDVVNTALDGIRRRQSKENRLRDIFNNNYTDYYHWLPKTDFFAGGFLNFRKLNALNKNDFDKKFGNPTIQISPFFVKDIVSRFSSFYARQGQPDIDSQNFIDRYSA